MTGYGRWFNCILLLIAISLVLSLCVQAEVTLPALLADHMVVQRGLPVHVWGMAAPGEAVSVSFRNESRSATADELGRWSVYLSSGEAGGPFSMTIKGANTITLTDVLVGDVWVASGQSNMEFRLSGAANAEAEIAAAKYPRIRLFHVKRKASDYPLANVAEAETWVACSSETVEKFSAIGYFFARDLQQKAGVPIGVIESSWGGTTAEAWTSLGALSADASLMPAFAARARMVQDQATTVLRLEKEEREFQQAAAQAKAEGKPEPAPLPWHPNFDSWGPAALYNGMIAPLTPFAIRGVIWYQGESNAGPERASWYARVLETLIGDWRKAWGQGDFPFLIVQIANWNADPESQWPEVRDAQRQALTLKNTGLVVTIDIGDAVDIHPKNKQDVGLRLALAARAIAYGEKIEYSGPLYRQLTNEDHALRVWFDHAASGLVARGEEVKGFEIAGADRKFSPAEAKIEGSSVVVSSSEVPAPVFVRYGWAANPNCNLYNRDGLPASPFQASH